MNNTEKIIVNSAVGLVTLVGLLTILHDVDKDQISFGGLLVPGSFVLFGVFFYFKNQILRVIPDQMKVVNPFFIMGGMLVLFFGIGLFLTGFLIYKNVDIVGAYVVSAAFILMPLFIWYSTKFGFKVSQKTLDREEKKREMIIFDNQKITVLMPLFESSYDIYWSTIESIVYTDFISDDNKKFSFYLKNPPQNKLSENARWYNRMADRIKNNNKVVEIDERAVNFEKIPKMVEIHLRISVVVDMNKDLRKGTLIKEKITQSGNKKTTYQQWKPDSSNGSEVLIFDYLGRSLEMVRGAI